MDGSEQAGATLKVGGNVDVVADVGWVGAKVRNLDGEREDNGQTKTKELDLPLLTVLSGLSVQHRH